MSGAIQLALLPEVGPRRVMSVSKKASPRPGEGTAEVLLQFQQRLRSNGLAPQSVAAIHGRIRTILALAERISGESLSPLELFGRPELLGMALAETRPLEPGRGEYARWTLAARRHAALHFGRSFSGELLALYGVPGEELVTRAIRSQARQVGSTYRLPGNLPFGRRTRVVTHAEARLLLSHLAHAPKLTQRGFGIAARIMFETGVRVNGLRHLDARDVFIDPLTNRVTILVRSKGTVIEYELSRSTGQALLDFINAVNCQLEVPAVRVGVAGNVWLTPRGLMSYRSWSRQLTVACQAVGIERLKPHDLRRSFATWASEVSSRADIALAGGWENTATLDVHYIHPRFPEFAASDAGGALGSRAPAPRTFTQVKERRRPDASAIPASVV